MTFEAAVTIATLYRPCYNTKVKRWRQKLESWDYFFLWRTVIDSLLKTEHHNYKAQAYADNLVIMMVYNNLNSHKLIAMQSQGWVVSNRIKGLSINPEKTEVVLFIKMRKTNRFVRLTYLSLKLNM